MRSNRRTLLALLIGFLLLAAVSLWQAGYWARSVVLSDIQTRSDDFLNLVVQNLRGELSKYQYQPRLLADSPILETALSNDATQQDVDRANEFLIQANDVSGAAATILLDRLGRTVAASRGHANGSFIGRNFGYRRDFQQAMQGSLGRDFALDPATGERSYYFAHPVRNGPKIVGAVAIEIPIGLLEPTWSSSDHKILVVDQDMIVFLSSHPEWRFHSLKPLTEATKNRLTLSRTYGTRAIAEIPIVERLDPDIVSIRDTPWLPPSTARSAPATSYLSQQKTLSEAGWTVMILSDTSAVNQEVTIWRAVAGFVLISLVLLAANIYQRRRRYAERMMLQEAAQRELETQVAERTADLTDANEQLRQAQAELVQATKLAALGQMSAGLSHELNQPLAAIRSYSDNANAFMDLDQPKKVKSNLSAISELTERMSRIIRNLRTYARNEPASLRPVSANGALSGALELLRGRAEAENVEIETIVPAKEIMVMAGAVRLQQVLVNLLSNALDAMDQTPEKHLTVSIGTIDQSVSISIADSGKGIGEEESEKLFDPFFSTKEVGEGMGLGLSITYGIIRQFGGEIEARNRPNGGAEFVVTLQAANAVKGEAA